MKIVESWLREWINPPLTIHQIAEQLTMAGLEVAGVQAVTAGFQNVMVGEVIAVQPHPDADRLSLCQVDIGTDQSLSIVCGASNVRVGLKAPVAVIGAELPNNFVIKKAKLRGIESCGMLCSAKELQLGDAETSKGLMELPNDAPIGVDLKQYLNLNDNILDIELTANRGDCLSMLGIAREVAALNNLPLSKFSEIKEQLECDHQYGGNFSDCNISITVAVPTVCPSYFAFVVKGIDNKVATPIWLKGRLEKSGLRSVNPVVDIANYVMLELGQPLHVFSLNGVEIVDGIFVRYAENQEKIIALDGNELTLTTDTLVIADRVKALAVAGVIGGKDSAVDENSVDILIESACFTPESIRKTAQRYGLKTDAAYRFERGVDYNLQSIAAARTRQLLLEIVGGVSSPTASSTSLPYLPTKRPIELHFATVNRLLGIELSSSTIINILQNLEMHVSEFNGGLNVLVPSHRFDISIVEDLVEEIARIYSYDKLPVSCINASLIVRPKSDDACVSDREIKNLLVAKDYCEVVTYSFVSPSLQQLLDPDGVPLALVNPISSELALMRTSLFPGLVNALQYNLHRGQNRVRLFEVGLCFHKNAAGMSSVEQKSRVAGIVTGQVLPTHWDSATSKREADFYDIKSDVEFLLHACHHTEGSIIFSAAAHPTFHPRRCAAVYLYEKLLGHIGELHPQIGQALGIKQLIYLFELDIQAFKDKRSPCFVAISKLPAIERDLAIIVDRELSWQVIKDKVWSVGGELLQSIKVFDIYQGDKVEGTKKSVALRLRFQHLSHTLTDKAIDVLIQRIVAILERDCSAVLRT